MEKDFLNTRQAAELIGLKANTLEIWRLRGTGPKYIKFGRAVRYRLTDLESYVDAQTRQSTSEKTA